MIGVGIRRLEAIVSRHGFFGELSFLDPGLLHLEKDRRVDRSDG